MSLPPICTVSLPRLPVALTKSPGATTALWEALRVFLRRSGSALRSYLKAACAAFLETAAQELSTAHADRAHDLAWSKLRTLTAKGGAKLKGARALPGRVGEDGVAATTPHEVAGVVLRHFAAVEAAEVCSVEALADRHSSSPPSLAPGTDRHLANVCDVLSLRRMFARSKRGKACGVDGIRDDFCAIAPVEMSDIMRPLLAKKLCWYRSRWRTSAALLSTCGNVRATSA